METWDAIRARRNVRDYEDRAIPDADLDQILEAGRRTPSASNRQGWDMVVVTDRAQLERLATVWRGAAHIGRSAATIALVGPVPADDRARDIVNYDLGQLTMSLMLAGVDLGVGSGHSSVGDQELAREILGLPEDHFCAWLIAMGYPADRPLTPLREHGRRPFEEVVHRGTW